MLGALTPRAAPKRALVLWADHVRSIAEGGARKVVPIRKA
jgi:hypothetical protein